MSTSCIIGWGHTPFGKLDAVDSEQLIRDAVLPALGSAGLQASDIDGVFVGHYNGGFLPQDFTASLVAMAVPELRHVPAVRLENACATGSAAIWAALDAVESGRVKHALVVGFEIMNAVPGPKIAETLLRCSYVKEEGTIPAGFAGVFGQIAGQYFERFGDQKRLGIHLRPVLALELCKQRGIAAHQPRFEQRGLHGDIARALGQAFSHRAHTGSDLQARVPAAANEAFKLGTQGAAGLGRRAVGQQQQDIDIGIGEQLVAPKAADRHQGHVIGKLGALPKGLQQVARQRRQLAQQHLWGIALLDLVGAGLELGAARLSCQAQPPGQQVRRGLYAGSHGFFRNLDRAFAWRDFQIDHLLRQAQWLR